MTAADPPAERRCTPATGCGLWTSSAAMAALATAPFGAAPPDYVPELLPDAAPPGRAEWVICLGCPKADAVAKIGVRVKPPRTPAAGPISCPLCKQHHHIEYQARHRGEAEELTVEVDRVPT